MGEQLERLKAALADRYAIERLLGEGGMAVVYLARDRKHDREVAVKVLRPELAVSLGADRFLREIKIEAHLQHPHILPLYDSGEADGFLYYVMPFVEGESLAELIEREHQLPLEDAIRYTCEIAEALHYAHQRGIVHRDIKPDNIMITGGHAVVADFGIANAVTSAGGERLTQTGMAVGTPAYMAPEQAMGADLDGRADIYSLGCTLYELLVGQIPFPGSTPQQILARHSVEEVPRPSIQRKTIPESLEEAVLCAMNKAPADRFRTAAEFCEALANIDTTSTTHRRHTTPTVVHRRPGLRARSDLVAALAATAIIAVTFAVWKFWPVGSAQEVGQTAALDPNRVAVLYFEDLTAGDLAYLADGLTESLIDRLSQVRELSVISRGGVERYRADAVSPDSVARVFQAGSVVKGTVERMGDQVRVMARLIDGNSGADIDRSTFELPFEELLAVRDSAAGVVARFFRKRLGEEVRMQERRASTSSVEAWSLVQRGERIRKGAEALLERDSVAAAFVAFARADSVLARAEAADPRWVTPVVLRGQIALRRSRLTESDRDAVRWIESGMEHARRALELEPNFAGAFELRGMLEYWHFLLGVIPDPTESADLLERAQADLELATKIDPTLAGAYSALSHLYFQTEEGAVSALMAARRAYEEDAYLTVANLVLWRLFSGHFDLEQLTPAQRWCDEGLRRFPDDFRFRECQLWLMASGGVPPDVERAWVLLADLERLVPAPEREWQKRRGQMMVGGVLARTGLADSARGVVERARAGRELDETFELAWIEAYIRVILGDYDEAIDRLRLYITANDLEPPNLEGAGEPYWWWRDLRDHPKFNEVRAATG